MKRTAGELAQYLGAHLDGDAGTLISGVASPEKARAEDLIYLDLAAPCRPCGRNRRHDACSRRKARGLQARP